MKSKKEKIVFVEVPYKLIKEYFDKIKSVEQGKNPSDSKSSLKNNRRIIMSKKNNKSLMQRLQPDTMKHESRLNYCK